MEEAAMTAAFFLGEHKLRKDLFLSSRLDMVGRTQLGGSRRFGRNMAGPYVSVLFADVPASVTFGVFAIPTRRKASAATPPPSSGPAQ